MCTYYIQSLVRRQLGQIKESFSRGNRLIDLTLIPCNYLSDTLQGLTSLGKSRLYIMTSYQVDSSFNESLVPTPHRFSLKNFRGVM
jgi:hypothetical protein